MNLGLFKRNYIEDGTSVPTAGSTGYPSGHTYIHRTTGKRYVNLGTLTYSIHRDIEGMSDRYTVEERFTQKPALKAVLDTYTASVASAEAVATNVANKNFEVVGGNMTTALVTAATIGGFTMTTAGGANVTDDATLQPQQSTDQTRWNINWNHLKNLRFEAVIKTEAAILTDGALWAGWKLTAASEDNITTDADQCFFKYIAATSANWLCIHEANNAGATTITTSSAVANSTIYHLVIQIDGDKIARFYVNSTLVGTAATALHSSAVNFKPIIGVRQTANSSDIAVTVLGIKCSQDY